MKIIAAAAVALTCVTATQAERKLIAGGELVPAGTKTYNVGLRNTAGGNDFCGGLLISPTLVLTSPECFNATIFPKLRWVSVGSHYRSGKEDGEQIKVTLVENHPKFDHDLQQYQFTVVELAKASSFTPVKLAKADDSDIKKSKWATSTGWGLTSEDGDPSKELHRADVDIWSDKKCWKTYGVDETVLCAGGTTKAGICGMDNGGPLVIESENGNDSEDVLVGVAMGSDGCGIGATAAYGRVSAAREWLDKIISESTQ